MIQIRRGTTANWRKASAPKLQPGQPGYDKTKHKLKIGDGDTSWADLPYASGLFSEEILAAESEAKTRITKDSEDETLITYGTDAPDSSTTGQLYLQYYEADPEADYITSQGSNSIWKFQKLRSGQARCWCTLKVSTTVSNDFDSQLFYYDKDAMKQLDYPFEFTDIPTETATVHSAGSLMVWLASRSRNTKKKSGAYSIVSPDKQAQSADYYISIQVEGYWR